MRRLSPSLFLRLLISLIFLITLTFVSNACSQNVVDPSVSKAETTITTPTGPDEVNERNIVSSELLKDLLDFNWEDINSATLTKYQDDIEVATVTIRDKEMIAQIEKLVNKLSIVHLSSDNVPVTDTNIIYEIILYKQKPEEAEIFLSLGPVYEDQTFAIGGSFIRVQQLNPRDRLIQTNQFVTFEDFENVFEIIINDE